MKYVIITPAYNEEKYIHFTLASVARQTILPVEWIVVNDSSTDQTREIVLEYAKNHDWIHLVDKEKSQAPFGANVVENFYYGFNRIKAADWDIVVKLDADLDIKRDDHFEFQIKKMKENLKLGITSGITYYTKEDGTTKEVWHPVWRTTGAMKLYRRECWEAMGGIVPIFGWDGIDEYRAMFHGFKTKTFYELKVHHLAKHASFARRNPEYHENKGKSLYIRGFPFYFIFLKCIQLYLQGNKMASKKLLIGFTIAKKSKEPRVVSREEIKFIRNFQFKRLFRTFKQ